MVSIEFDGLKFNVPQSWEDITLGVYEQIFRLKPEDTREQVAIIAKICGVEPDTLINWPAEIFNMMVPHVLFVWGDNPYTAAPFISVTGHTPGAFAVSIEDRLTLGEWIDADAAQKEDAPLSNTLAIVCRPVGEAYNPDNNEARQKLFAALTMDKIHPVLGFFLQCSTILKKHTNQFSNLQQAADLLPRSTQLLQSLGIGTKLLRIYPIIRYLILMRLLRARLKKYLLSYSTSGKKILLKRPNAN